MKPSDALKVVLVSKDVSQNIVDLIAKTLSGATGKETGIHLLREAASAESKAVLRDLRPDIVHFSSLDHLDEDALEAAAAAGAVTAADAGDLYRFCRRGRMFGCDRRFCRDETLYRKAQCFASHFENADEKSGAKAASYKKYLPGGVFKRRAFLNACRLEGEIPESSEIAAAGGCRDAVRLLGMVDYFFCADYLRLLLLEFGIDPDRALRDETFVSLEEAGDAALIERRAKHLAGAYEMMLGRRPFGFEYTDSRGAHWPQRFRQHFRDRTPKWQVERENGILLMQDLSGKRLAWESRPSHVEFSTNNICNLRCITCSPHGRPRKEEMTEREARDIGAQVLPRASLLTPSAGSEPLLGDFELIVDLCREHRVQMNPITNAVLLTPDRFRVMEDVLGGLQLSLLSHEKDVYERICAGAKFEATVENMRQACRLAAAKGIYVSLQFIVMTLTWERMAEYVDFAAALGASAVSMMKLLIVFPELEELSVDGKAPEERMGKEFARAIEAARTREIDLHIGIGRPSRSFLFNRKNLRPYKLRYLAQGAALSHPSFCGFAAHYVKIAADGSVYPCCRDMEDLNMGNVKREPFESIWNGERYQALREEFYGGRPRKSCADCPIRDFVRDVLVCRPA